jgi:hypothetical protein
MLNAARLPTWSPIAQVGVSRAPSNARRTNTQGSTHHATGVASSLNATSAAGYRRKHPPGFAQCGINWYPAGSGWTHCHKCGQALVYTTDHNAPCRDCPGHRP